MRFTVAVSVLLLSATGLVSATSLGLEARKEKVKPNNQVSTLCTFLKSLPTDLTIQICASLSTGVLKRAP